VRPFVLEEVVLSEAAEEEGFDLTDQMEVTKFLRTRVSKHVSSCGVTHLDRQANALIDHANTLWEERNVRAVEEGEQELAPMLPLIRIKVCFY
jgi:double-strand break repair protein MRE11